MTILNLLETAQNRAFQSADHDTIGEARELIAEVHAVLDGVEWNADTPQAVAGILARYGLEVTPYDPED